MREKAEPVFVPVVRPKLDELIERMGTLADEHYDDRDGTKAAEATKEKP